MFLTMYTKQLQDKEMFVCFCSVIYGFPHHCIVGDMQFLIFCYLVIFRSAKYKPIQQRIKFDCTQSNKTRKEAQRCNHDSSAESHPHGRTCKQHTACSERLVEKQWESREQRDHGADTSPSNELLKSELQTCSLQRDLYENGCLTVAGTSQTLVPLRGLACLSMSV